MEIVHQENCGRSYDSSGRKVSKHTSLPIRRYFNEASDVVKYHAKQKEFESMTIICGNKKESP